MATKFQDKVQGDLFDQLQTADKRIRKKVRFLLPNVKNSIALSYDIVIFIIIGFFMFCMIFFSLGVEKGRHDINYEKDRPQVSELKEQLKPKIETNIEAETQKEPAPIPTHTGTIKKTYDRWTVQLVSFKKREYAENELSKLKKEGHTAYIKQSGDYYQVYMGYFDTKLKAVKLQNAMKSKYRDCYIK